MSGLVPDFGKLFLSFYNTLIVQSDFTSMLPISMSISEYSISLIFDKFDKYASKYLKNFYIKNIESIVSSNILNSRNTIVKYHALFCYRTARFIQEIITIPNLFYEPFIHHRLSVQWCGIHKYQSFFMHTRRFSLLTHKITSFTV